KHVWRFPDEGRHDARRIPRSVRSRRHGPHQDHRPHECRFPRSLGFHVSLDPPCRPGVPGRLYAPPPSCDRIRDYGERNMSYLAVFAVLSLLIVVHEAGHLLAARLVGIPIASFSVGLGPKLWSRRWGRVEYVLRALPLCGFVVPAI